MNADWLSLGLPLAPWLAVAGLGALHGLNPATGWMFAATWAVRSRDRMRAWCALLPIAIGHAASIALVAITVPLSFSTGRVVLQALAGGLLVVVAIVHWSGRKIGSAPRQCLSLPFVPSPEPVERSKHEPPLDSEDSPFDRLRANGQMQTETLPAPAAHAGLALWSFMMSTAHGAGLMLVPALIPLCMANMPGREIVVSGSLTLALAAVGVHTAAMLAVTGAMAASACRCFDVGAGRLRIHCRHPQPTPH